MRFFIFAAVLLASIKINAAPLPKKLPVDPEIKQISPIPDLAKIGRTNYGFFVQIHRDIVLAGGSCWTANGIVREDGSIFLSWFGEGSDYKNPAYIGIYRFDGKELRGTYCVPSALSYDAKGSLVGSADRLVVIRRWPPSFFDILESVLHLFSVDVGNLRSRRCGPLE